MESSGYCLFSPLHCSSNYSVGGFMLTWYFIHTELYSKCYTYKITGGGEKGYYKWEYSVSCVGVDPEFHIRGGG